MTLFEEEKLKNEYLRYLYPYKDNREELDIKVEDMKTSIFLTSDNNKESRNKIFLLGLAYGTIVRIITNNEKVKIDPVFELLEELDNG